MRRAAARAESIGSPEFEMICLAGDMWPKKLLFERKVRIVNLSTEEVATRRCVATLLLIILREYRVFSLYICKEKCGYLVVLQRIFEN
jgi:hypothetical protein